MFHWIADSRSGFVVLLMAAFIVAMAMYALPALLVWSEGRPQRVAITLVDLLLAWTPSRGWTIIAKTTVRALGRAIALRISEPGCHRCFRVEIPSTITTVRRFNLDLLVTD